MGRVNLGLTLSTSHSQCQHTNLVRDGHRREADNPVCPIPAEFYHLDFLSGAAVRATMAPWGREEKVPMTKTFLA